MPSALNRRWRRAPANWPAVIAEGDRRSTCTLLELSRVGARLRVAEAPPLRARITILNARTGALDATVIWSKGDIVGVAFDPLPRDGAEKLRALLAELEETARRPARPRPRFGRRADPGGKRR